MRLVTQCVLAILVCCLAWTATPAAAVDLGELDGTWEGTLAVVATPAGAPDSNPYSLRLVIHGTDANVFARYGSTAPYQEVKPGKFHIARLGPSGIVAVIDSGHDEDGMWIETWNFTVTLKQHDAMIVNFSRFVNNVDMPPNADHSKFTETMTGELARTK